MSQDVSGNYLLLDGTMAAPGDCEAGKDGVLRNKAGIGVAVDGDGKPQTIGGVTELNKAAAEAAKRDNKNSSEDEKTEAKKTEEFKFAEPPHPPQTSSADALPSNSLGQPDRQTANPAPAPQQPVGNIVRPAEPK